MLHNLLPLERKKEIKREYFIRLATVATILFSVVFLAGSIFLLPSYMEVKSALHAKKGEFEKRHKETEENVDLQNQIENTLYSITVLEDDLEKVRLTEYINTIFEKKPEGITVIGFSYNKAQKSISLQSISRTRDLVAPFARTLEASEYFSTVPVPISDLVGKTDLDFVLNIGINEF
jgi:hypothetical protein